MAVSLAKEPGYYGDGGGLYPQVSASGTKGWIFRYSRLSKERQMGRGPMQTVSLAQARDHDRACRATLLAGGDPLDQRKAEQLEEALDRAKTITFDYCAAAYVAAHRGSWKNKKHAAQWESPMATYASPIIGQRAVGSIDTHLILTVLQPI